MLSFTVVLNSEEDGYVVSVPALPGCTTEGSSREEALRNVQDAIRLYVEDLISDGEAVPEDVIPELLRLDVEAPAARI